jgi:hypothetical protein
MNIQIIMWSMIVVIWWLSMQFVHASNERDCCADGGLLALRSCQNLSIVRVSPNAILILTFVGKVVVGTCLAIVAINGDPDLEARILIPDGENAD